MRARTCPTCGEVAKQEGNKLFPFCGERCQLVDLGRWLSEDYRVPDESMSPPTPKTPGEE